MLVDISQPGKEPPAALAELDPREGGLWSVALGLVREDIKLLDCYVEWEGVKVAMPSLDFKRESFLPMGQGKVQPRW